jgi:hypothetical protein
MAATTAGLSSLAGCDPAEVTRTRPAASRSSSAAADHLERARRAPRNFLLLETSEVQQRALEDRALAAREHAVAVQISLNYYSNPNVKARPHRIPRYWLPTMARW